jgi:DNA-binding IclR family transcriptional regulator
MEHSELSRRPRIPKSTTHVIVLTLERLGYLTLDANTRKYALGLKVSGLGRGLIKSRSLPERALRPMQWLVEVTRCTSQVGRFGRRPSHVHPEGRKARFDPV